MGGILNMADKAAPAHCACAVATRKRTFPMHGTEVCFILTKDADYSRNSDTVRSIALDEGVGLVLRIECGFYPADIVP
jgi:hypothetical protein